MLNIKPVDFNYCQGRILLTKGVLSTFKVIYTSYEKLIITYIYRLTKQEDLNTNRCVFGLGHRIRLHVSIFKNLCLVIKFHRQLLPILLLFQPLPHQFSVGHDPLANRHKTYCDPNIFLIKSDCNKWEYKKKLFCKKK